MKDRSPDLSDVRRAQAMATPAVTETTLVGRLLETGLHVSVIARAIQVSPRTVHSWSVGAQHPSSTASRRLIDLDAILRILVTDRGLSPVEASNWLVSSDPVLNQRPVDILASAPDRVFAAAFTPPGETFGEALRRRWISPEAVQPDEAIAGPEDQGLSDEQAALPTATGLVDPDGRPLTSADPAYRDLAVAFQSVSDAVLRRLADKPQLLFDLHWRDFEELVADLFTRDGFEVTLTKPSHDGGVDLFAVRHTGLGRMLYAVECKRYTKPVGPDLVRKLAWVVERERANAGVLATTSRFTAGARTEQQRTLPFRMSLADLNGIEGWLRGEPIL